MFGRKKKQKAKESPLIKVALEPVGEGTEFNEDSLVEISDEMLLARLNQAVPELSLVIYAGDKAVNGSKCPIYKYVLPSDVPLHPSRELKTSVKNFFLGRQGRVHAALSTNAVLASTASLALSIVAFAVGQKYLSDIAKRLDSIHESLNRISEFQYTEYRSKAQALIEQIARIVTYWNEIGKNDEVRQRTLINLDNLEAECLVLLGQATETIEGYTRKRILDFEKYCEETAELQSWIEYQDKLLAVLYHISELKYSLGMGTVSKEFCTASFHNYLPRATKSRKALRSWHEAEIAKLKIDPEASLKKRKGIDAAVHFIPSLVKKEQKYYKIPEPISDMIKEQLRGGVSEQVPVMGDIFHSDVQLIVRGGKVYYFREQGTDEGENGPPNDDP